MSSFSLWSVISSCFEDGGGRFPFGHIRGKNLGRNQSGIFFIIILYGPEPVSETWDNLGFTPKFLDTNRPKREQKVAAKHILQSITQPLKWSFWLSLNIP